MNCISMSRPVAHLLRQGLTWALLALTALLAACGGGGGDAGSDAVAPAITTQPASVSIVEGQMATFSVTAGGTGPLAYQWRLNGADITGATAASVTTPAATASASGAQYSVAVSNSAGSVTSQVATLTVGPMLIAPSITTQPANTNVVAGSNASFQVVASGSGPLGYQWRRNGQAIAGASAASYTTAATADADSGALFSVVVSNAAGSATSNNATLTVTPAAVPPTITAQPAGITVNAGQSASFTVAASGTAPFTYQWRRNGIDIAGASAASYTTPATVDADTGTAYSAVVGNAAGSVTSANATLTVTPATVAPAIGAAGQPASVSVTEGGAATFTVVASGSAPLAYQWQRNGIAIAGATDASYTLAAVTLADNGALFQVVIGNAAGTLTSASATLTVGALIVPASITTQPANASVTVSATATFNVTATGTAPLAYQWRRNGVTIAGATGASYTTPATVLADSGTVFSVIVGNPAGSVTSADASLVVNAAPVAPAITSQPSDATVTVGETATFSITATGSAPLAYQWKRNGSDIVGATAASYTTAGTVIADNGSSFTVTVRNAANTVTSRSATLTVNALAWTGIREGGASGLSVDSAKATSTDRDGNVVIGGSATSGGPFTGDVAGRESPAFVAKYSAGGVLLWARRFPNDRNGNADVANGVATDAAGNVYAVGSIYGTLPGQIRPGGNLDSDVAVLKYNAAGTLIWARQFGTNRGDTGAGIAVDANGNVFVVGDSLSQLPTQPANRGQDFFIAKFDSDGNRLWVRQSGSSNGTSDFGRGVAVDAAGNAYMTGTIVTGYQDQPNPGNGFDAYVLKYDADGNVVWFSRIPGQGNDDGNAIAVASDGNTVYITGETASDFSVAGYPRNAARGGRPTAFIAQMNGSGTLQWVQNLASAVGPGPTYFIDIAYGITTDAAGSAAYITGSTTGVMPGTVPLGAQDIFVARYESNGSRTWVRQFGADIPATGTRNDAGYAITLDRNGDLFVAGEVHGTFGTPNPSLDRTDWFVMKLKRVDGVAY